jgi:hypothetical protein
MIIICERCGNPAEKRSGDVNRSKAGGYRVFCSRKCSGLARRNNKTREQKVEDKRLYDMAYRAKNVEKLRQRHHEYHVRTYDPVKAAMVRKKNMPRHVEYCRRPEYRAYKKAYDKVYTAEKNYGPFAGVALTLRDLESEIRERVTHAESIQANGIYNKRQYCARETAGEATHHGQRKRHRSRHYDHSQT